MYKVQVLLSSYNGEKYIKKQIDSILNQKEVDISLLIRDDGSKDKTIEIIKNINDKRISLIKGDNVGVARSFFHLIHNSGNQYDYFALSDQDDVWDDDKLISAIKCLKRYDQVPAIYSSNTRLVDKDLNFIKTENFSPKTTLGSAIVKNYVKGCTVVFNKQLKKYIILDDQSYIQHHDWWINLVALAVGGVSVFDTVPHIMYRQHGKNVEGAPSTFYEKWKRRLKKYLNYNYKRDLMASRLLTVYSKNINSKTSDLLNSIIKYKEKPIKVILNPKIRTGNIMDDIAFAFCIITKKA